MCLLCISVLLQPKYEAYMKLFEPLCGPAPQRPILTEGANKVNRPSTACGIAVLLVFVWAYTHAWLMGCGAAGDWRVLQCLCL